MLINKGNCDVKVDVVLITDQHIIFIIIRVDNNT